jgi:hypothetical protein
MTVYIIVSFIFYIYMTDIYADHAVMRPHVFLCFFLVSV